MRKEKEEQSENKEAHPARG
jgi:hypothetical protein